MAARRACCGCGTTLVDTGDRPALAVALCSSCWRARPYHVLHQMDAQHAQQGHGRCHPRTALGAWPAPAYGSREWFAERA